MKWLMLLIIVCVSGAGVPRLLPPLQQESDVKRILPRGIPYRDRVVRSTLRGAKATGVPPALVASVITVESRGVWYAVSGKGAQGLMQVMPCHSNTLYWVREQAGKEGTFQPVHWFNIEDNVMVGCIYLSNLMARFDTGMALLAYNNGHNSKIVRLANQHPIFWVEDNYVGKVQQRFSVAILQCTRLGSAP